MKKILYLILPLLVFSLIGCANESLNNNFNQYHSEEFVDEKAVNNMDIPHIVISFNLNYEIDKSTLLEESTMEEVKEFIKNQREKTKDYFSQNNKKLLNNMNLELKNEKVYISNYSNCVFIELDENKSIEYYDELLLKINSYDYVQSAYYG